MADPTPTTCRHARCQPWPTCQYRRDSCPGCSALAIEVERIVAVREVAARADERKKISAAVWAAPHLTTIEQPSGARAVRFYDRALRFALAEEADRG